MKRIFIAVLLLSAFSFAASAQLTTGNPSAKEIRTGNRPQAGDFGLYFGVSSTDIAQLISGYANPLPVINFKYYLSNQLEIRAGLDSGIEKHWLKGPKKGVADKDVDKEGGSYFMIEPGIAYHFSKHNIIDVYAGAELPLGWDSYSKTAVDGAAKTSLKQTNNAFVIGLKPFVGLQCFIANLPMALGVEYGFFGYTRCGDKNKFTAESGGTKQVYYEDLDGIAQYDKLSAGTLSLQHEVRLTFSYYFK